LAQGEDELGNLKDYLLATFIKRGIDEILADEGKLKNKEDIEDMCYSIGNDRNGKKRLLLNISQFSTFNQYLFELC